jgi:hypothetical protein
MIDAFEYYLGFSRPLFGDVFAIAILLYYIRRGWRRVLNRYGILDLNWWIWITVTAWCIASEVVLRLILSIIVLVARG